MTRDEIVETCQAVRKGRKRAVPLAGVMVEGRQVVICPSWEEKAKLEGKGVLPLHADEMETMASTQDMTTADKIWLCGLMLRFQGIRLLKVARDQGSAT